MAANVSSMRDRLETYYLRTGDLARAAEARGANDLAEEALASRSLFDSVSSMNDLIEDRFQNFDIYSNENAEQAVYNVLIPKCESHNVKLSDYGNHAAKDSLFSIQEYETRKQAKTLFVLRRIQQAFRILKKRLQLTNFYHTNCNNLRKGITELGDADKFLDGYLIAAAMFTGCWVRFRKQKNQPIGVTCEFRAIIIHLSKEETDNFGEKSQSPIGNAQEGSDSLVEDVPMVHFATQVGLTESSRTFSDPFLTNLTPTEENEEFRTRSTSLPQTQVNAAVQATLRAKDVLSDPSTPVTPSLSSSPVPLQSICSPTDSGVGDSVENIFLKK